jgi:two-component system sensor histidine kinase SenX3
VDGFVGDVPIVIAALVGLLVGVAGTVAFHVSDRAQRRVPPQPDPELDDGLVRVLSVLRSAVVVLDGDDDVMRASPPAYALGLVRNDQLTHQAVREMVRDTRRDWVIRERELELPRGLAGSGTVSLQVRVAPLDVGRILILAEDRTEAQRVAAIRRDFVANVSHELKTPVGAIALLAETVALAADDPVAVRRFSGRIEAEAHRLSALVHEIIELSRVQGDGALTDARAVVVGNVVAEAVDRARTAAAAKNIVVSLSLDDDAAPGGRGPVVFGDHDLLVTAVRNLIDNAVAYSGPNTAVGICVAERDGLVEIGVADQGIGIAPGVQQRVFERFYRVDPARSRDTGGTGLGLSIVKHVAADHGGDVQVWSQPGKGSTFTLRIPVAQQGR